MGRFRDIGSFIEERTSLGTAAARFLDANAPAGAWVSRLLASAIAACVGVLALTGVALMMAYSPSPQAAWASVHYIEFVQAHGWIIRGLHFWAAQALFVLAALGILHGALVASYRAPREFGWWLTLAVLGLTLAELITGGLLPWDQRGWWGRVVEANIVGMAPVVGGWIGRMISGGSELGALGLARAYTAHVVLLPLPLVLALWGQRVIARRHGWAPGADSRSVPYIRLLGTSAVFGAIVVCALFALTGWARHAPLEAPADPMSDYPARPEWFLMTLYRLRKYFHGPMEFWGTTALPGVAAGYFVLLPWIERRLSRVVAILGALGIFAGAAALGVVGIRHDAHDSQYVKAHAKWEKQAAAAIELAKVGVPPDGALAMERRDPELRGRDLFEKHCASCHVLGDLGDPKKASASRLDGWGTAAWIEAMMHDPDAPEFFGRGPYVEQMPSVDTPPKKPLPKGEVWIAMIKNAAERKAVALFLAAEGDEPFDAPRPKVSAKTLAEAEKIVSERCSTCHLYKGDGDDEGSGIAPELSRYGSLEWTRAQIANPASPTVYRSKALDPEMKKHMPRFDKDLSGSDIDLLARYVRLHGRSSSL
jgi:ubiquinol-cytochrome c reductase cytochrome b subunit